MLERYCGVRLVASSSPASRSSLGDVLEVEAFPTGGDPPLYMTNGAGSGMTAMGLTIRDRETGGVLSYAPALESIDDEHRRAPSRRATSSASTAPSGRTTSSSSLGLAERDALRDGAHAADRARAAASRRSRRCPRQAVLVHVNNTNPILLDDSAERAIVTAERHRCRRTTEWRFEL